MGLGPQVRNSDLSLSFDLEDGVLLVSILDEVTHHEYLARPTALFEFAVNNGIQCPSDRGLIVERVTPAAGGGQLRIDTRARGEPLAIQIHLSTRPSKPVVIVRLIITNTGDRPTFLRTVLPKINGLVTPGDVADRMGAVPQEIGSVVSLQDDPPLGMGLNLDIGLPTAMNMMEVATLYDSGGRGGVFFADTDGQLDGDLSPIQLNLGAEAVLGFWIADIAPSDTAQTPGLAIGVFHRGDWHEAVDYYEDAHRANWRFPSVPAWFRDQGAMYCFSGGGAGAAYMALPVGNLNDGAVWTTWEANGGPWRDGDHDRHPLPVSTSGLAPAGSPVVAVAQNPQQIDVFVVGHDGAVWATWESHDGPWRDGRKNRWPARVTPPCLAPPGAPVAAAKQNDNQLDVFVVGHDGAIWVTWESHDGPWHNGEGGRLPVRISPPGFAPPGAHLAAAKQNDRQLDVFVVRDDGAIWVTWEADDGPWRDGVDGRDPARVTTTDLARPGAPLAAAKQKDNQLNVFVTGRDGAVHVTWEVDDGPWRDGVAGRLGPAPVTTLNLAPSGAAVAAIMRHEAQQDVFVVGKGRIRSFRQLPLLLEDAQKLGTNIVYLFDYWEGVDEGGYPPYWNKGDYIPRSDLGGEDSLIEGIRAVHAAGGRVILYVEPFIIYRHSMVGRVRGEAWAARWPGDEIQKNPYEDYYKMVAPFVPWQDYLVQVVQRLVCLYGADGIFLDSWAWQMNWPVHTGEDGRLFSPRLYSLGVLELTRRVRDAVRRIKPDAVVIGETTSGPISRYWDGGLSADFAWDQTRAINRAQLLGSPVRYAIPEVYFLGNGKDLNELHQVYAAGHGLAVSSYWPGSFMYEHAGHIRRLVQIRQEFKDALAYGRQAYQPLTGGDVVAYYYQGARHEIITVVNTSQTTAHTVDLELQDAEGSTWRDQVPEANNLVVTALGNRLPAVPMPPDGLRVFLRLGS
jgi:hypothetical protein